MIENIEESGRCLVIDIGTQFTRCGLAGDDFPRNNIHTVVGRARGHRSDVLFVGKEALSYSFSVKASYPIQNGVVQDWEAMLPFIEKLYLSELGDEEQNIPVLLSEAPLMPVTDRQRMTELMFESIDVPSMSMCSQSALVLFSTGNITGVVLDMGHQRTYAVPIYDGHPVQHATQHLNLGGQHITEYYATILRKQFSAESFCGYHSYKNIDNLIDPSSDLYESYAFKNDMCYVAPNFEDELKKSTPKTYVLPDGTSITLAEERFTATEALFQPTILRIEGNGILDMTMRAVKGCNDDALMNYMLSNIELAGGNSVYDGIAARLFRDISQHPLCQSAVNVNARPERKYATWIGGSVVASLSSFQNNFITKEEYLEWGSRIIQYKCF
jgi:actin